MSASHVATATDTATPAWAPPLELTKGQPRPGSVSRWSFHTACIDPTAPDDAPCRRNVVVRSFVFF